MVLLVPVGVNTTSIRPNSSPTEYGWRFSMKVGDLVLEAVEKRARDVRPPLMGIVLAVSKAGYHYHIQWTNGKRLILVAQWLFH